LLLQPVTAPPQPASSLSRTASSCIVAGYNFAADKYIFTAGFIIALGSSQHRSVKKAALFAGDRLMFDFRRLLLLRHENRHPRGRWQLCSPIGPWRKIFMSKHHR
jgi:hypothetical protein